METDFQTELWHRIQCSSWRKTQHVLPLDSKNLSVCIRSKICAVACGRGRGLDAAAQNKLTYTELFGGEEEDSFSINDSSSLITESLWLNYPFLCPVFFCKSWMKQLILQHIKNINSVQQQKTHGENQNLDTSTHAGGLYDNCKHSSARSDPGTRLTCPPRNVRWLIDQWCLKLWLQPPSSDKFIYWWTLAHFFIILAVYTTHIQATAAW